MIRYFNLRDKIAVEYYQGKLNTIILDGEIEIDETFLFKDKKSKAKHRRNKRSLWLFGMIQREDHQFVIIPVYSKDGAHCCQSCYILNWEQQSTQILSAPM